MSRRALEFIIPGDLQSATGGYVYDRTMVAGLRALGWRVSVHGLDASFPSPTPDALAQAQRIFAGLPEQASVLIDGLALGAIPQVIEPHSRRLAMVALIHMPLASEVGIAPAVAERLHGQERRALQFVRHAIVTSRSTQRALVEDGVDQTFVSVVEPGVWRTPIGRAHDGRAAHRAGDACNGGPSGRGDDAAVKLLCVATVHEGKGHGLLIDALARLAHLPWHLQCAGSLTRSPATAQRLTDRLQRLRLGERVALVGELPHAALSELYLAADLFVLPTLRESYGMAVAEALAHGVPVISTRTGAIPELVGTGAGLLIEPGDRDALRAALEQSLTDGALRSSMRAAALAVSARLTPWPQACERMAQILARVCERTAC
jgi:glycosyltransferase involved in cell wall biosynthesis